MSASGRSRSLICSGRCKSRVTSCFLNRQLYVVLFGAVSRTTGVTHIPPLIHSGIVLRATGVDFVARVGG